MRKAALLLGWLAAGAVLAADGGGRTPLPAVVRAAVGTQCVADPDFMRRNHMDLLKHQRDDTVRGGVRGGKFSLKACIACHASTTTMSVAQAPGDFCVACHSYAAVTVDCFECHSSQAPARAVGAAR